MEKTALFGVLAKDAADWSASPKTAICRPNTMSFQVIEVALELGLRRQVTEERTCLVQSFLLYSGGWQAANPQRTYYELESLLLCFCEFQKAKGFELACGLIASQAKTNHK